MASTKAKTGPPSVSDIKYWIQGSKGDPNQTENEYGDEGATYLSYEVFLGLAVLGGFFALDHLYLRSPWTFLAKFFVNIFLFGIWWFYDAMQAVFNTDTVKVYGLGVPGLGPQGIAAGVLSSPTPSQKHLRFFTYAAALFFGGAFGLDSFLVGDRQTGVMRLLALLSMIGIPLALAWWAYKLFQFFTNTRSVTDSYGTYFGSGADQFGSGSLLGWLLSPAKWLQRLLGPVMDPLVAVLETAVGTVDKAVNTVGRAVNLGTATLAEGSKIATQLSDTVQTVSQGFGPVMSALPGAALYSAVTPDAVAAEVSKQTGGAVAAAMGPNALPYALLGTILIISLAGFLVTYYRSYTQKKQTLDGKSPRDDTPPRPRDP